ncbi:MFS transporter [Bordetella sp. BOR01]|uniref:MFS transporter n=1 Tax=Bordetella sp. BOR01 TaxID=2854779 RepID=UPI001C495552|nr:MFS transporter [Bordetella sp. BOR01]MBV7483953.1 MFS transporter [Bordetella sp. BOR01]
MDADVSVLRRLVGLLGIFLAAITTSLATRMGTLALADVRGALGFGFDAASWLTTAHAAAELIAMPFSAWFAITVAMRRFVSWVIALSAAACLLVPWAHSLEWMLVLRVIQGLAGGALIPLLMMAALKFLPAPVKLYGLALYSLTATLAPTLAIWLVGVWTDHYADWRLVYWQSLPLLAMAGALSAWGLPRDAARPERWRQCNWIGLACGAAALGALAVALDQAVRLDGFQSPLIAFCTYAGLLLLAAYLYSEWRHPDPFLQLRLLARRNLGLGFTIFVCMLTLLSCASLLPVGYLGRVWGYRALQSAPIGLIIGVAQLVLAPAVAALLYRKWLDARIMFSLGLVLIACACWQSAGLTSAWVWQQFIWVQALNALGQPMAVVSLLFLATSVVQPREGPYVSGTINTLRGLGSLLAGTVVGQALVVRERWHAEGLLDRLGRVSGILPGTDAPSLAAPLHEQAFVMATADVYRAAGLLALLLIPLVLSLHRRQPPASLPEQSHPHPG